MKTVKNIMILLGAVLCLAVSCSSDDKGGNEKPFTADYTIKPGNVLVENYVGVGTQYNNNLYTTRTYNADGVTEANLPDLIEKVKNLRSQYVRIFFDRKCWEGYNGYDAEYWPSFVKTVELAHATGAVINITYWHTSNAVDMPKFGEVLHDLIVTRGLTSVKQVTIQNEVNSTQITHAEYNASYRALQAKLTDLGIRNQVEFVGGDLLQDGQAAWFAYMADNMSDILDGYSSHIYWTYPSEPNKATDRLDGINGCFDAMQATQRRPAYITEFGVRGTKKGDQYDQPGYYGNFPIGQTVDNGVEHARFILEGMNRGFAGFVKWDCYKAKYDNGVQWHCVIGSGTDGYPLYHTYHLLRLFTLTSESGWKVVQSENQRKDDTYRLVSALKSADGSDLTVYVLNKSNGGLMVKVDGLPANTTFRAVSWNGKQDGILRLLDPVTTDAEGRVKIPTGAKGMTAITTLDVTL